MRQALASDYGGRPYRRRKAMVEPCSHRPSTTGGSNSSSDEDDRPRSQNGVSQKAWLVSNSY